MNGTMNQETSCGPNQEANDNTIFSGSDHTRNDVEGGQIYHSEPKSEADWDDEQTRSAARKRSSRICKMEEKKKEEEEKRAEEEAEAERKAEEKRVARQRRKQVKEMHQSTDDQQRRMYGVYPTAHRDGVQYMLPAGMVAGLPHGHMIPVGPHGPGMPPQMMQQIMMQPAPHQHMSSVATAASCHNRPAATGWPSSSPTAAAPAAPAAPAASSQPAPATASGSSAQRPHADTNRSHSGWTPVASKKLPARFLKQRIPRKKAQRARIRLLAEVTASWGVESPATVTPDTATSGALAGSGPQPQPNSAEAKARAAMVRDDLMQRRAETTQQLRKYVESGKISAEMAQQRMAEVDQLSNVVIQVCPQHPTATLPQLVNIAQSIISARQQQRQIATRQHPMFARLTGEQQRQLLDLPHQHRTQVLANLTAQHSNTGQGGPQSHMSQQSHMSHFHPRAVAPQMQMRPQAAPHPFSQPQMMPAPHDGQMPVHTQHLAMQAQHAQHSQHAQRMQQGQQAAQAQRAYSVQNISPLDDPLMTTMH